MVTTGAPSPPDPDEGAAGSSRTLKRLLLGMLIGVVLILLYLASGTNAVRSRNLLERYFRDVHAAMFHAGGLPATFEQGGRVALGLPAGAPGW